MARRPTDGMESESLWRQNVERRLRAIESGTRLQSASIGAGGITIKDGGAITVEGGDVTVQDDGSILIEGADATIIISPTAAGANNPGIRFEDDLGAFLGQLFGTDTGAVTIEGGGNGNQLSVATDLIRLIIDAVTTALEVDRTNDTNPISIRVNSSLKRVTQGAADSGGSGFRVLRVPN